ncbi:PREDICTED: uncharacterized protein LOC101309011 [Fragaria vesca subsp. vesca]
MGDWVLQKILTLSSSSLPISSSFPISVNLPSTSSPPNSPPPSPPPNPSPPSPSTDPPPSSPSPNPPPPSNFENYARRPKFPVDVVLPDSLSLVPAESRFVVLNALENPTSDSKTTSARRLAYLRSGVHEVEA